MSERVLTDKIKMRPYGEGGIAFSDDGCKCGEGGLVVMDFDGDPFAVEQHASGCDDEEIAARVILALAARVAELELDREGRIRSSDYDKALIEELEAEVAVLSGTACAEEQAEGNGPCGACRTCRNKRITELEAENTKLRDGAFSKTVASEVEEALRDRIAADTALTDKSKGDTPLGYVRIGSLLEAFENLSFVRQQLTDAKQQLEETKWECRNLEAENAKLRKCVEKGDDYIDSIYSITSNTGLLHAEWSEKIDYYAARAEVDK